ncbi:MAG: hypothetical protein AAGF90_16175 [Pseudomonadota bacterium]
MAHDVRPREVHMSPVEVRAALDELADRPRGGDDEAMTRLAWRPAWAIRSRRGALRPLRELLGALLRRGS